MANKRQLIIRFRGIISHLDLTDERTTETKKRALLLRHLDAATIPIEHHVPHIEFLADDIDTAPGLEPVTYTRRGTDTMYARIDIDDKNTDVVTEISVNCVPAGVVTSETNYDTDVTHFGSLLPDFKKLRIAESLTGPAEDVRAERVVAFFDMPAGRLIAGEPEGRITRFPAGVVNFTARRLARWADLLVTVEGPVVLKLTRRPGTPVEKTITFKDTLRMITIGNEPERLILGLVGNGHDHSSRGHGANGDGHGNGDEASGRQSSGHFVVHYNVFDPIPKVRPLPIPTLLETGGCGPNNIP